MSYYPIRILAAIICLFACVWMISEFWMGIMNFADDPGGDIQIRDYEITNLPLLLFLPAIVAALPMWTREKWISIILVVLCFGATAGAVKIGWSFRNGQKSVENGEVEFVNDEL